MTLPIVIIVFGMCLGGLASLGSRVQLIDQAGQAARLIGRGHDPGDVQRIVGASEPLHVERDNDLVCVYLSRQVGLLPVDARSCALDEGQ